MKRLEGAYSLVLLTDDSLIGVRDPFGVRPLCIGSRNGGWVIAAESCALAHIGASFIREVEPGEIVVVNSEGFKSFTDERLRAYYDEHTDRFHLPETVRARHILVTPVGLPPNRPPWNQTGDDAVTEEEARQKAEWLLEELERGGSFAELARKYSEDGSARAGGDLGYFPRGRMVKAFEDVCFSLLPGQHSEVVKTEFGYHLIQLLDHVPERQFTFEEAKEEILDRLMEEEPEGESESSDDADAEGASE